MILDRTRDLIRVGDQVQRQHLRHRSARPHGHGRSTSIELAQRWPDDRPRLGRAACRTSCVCSRTACAPFRGDRRLRRRQHQQLRRTRSIASSRRTARTTCSRTTRRIRKRDGKFHNIQVRVNRPGLTVRARRGYANPSRQGAGACGANPASRLTAGDARRAREPAAGQRPDHAGVRGAVQGHGAERVGAARRRDARAGSAPRRRRQARSSSYFAVDAKGKYRGGNTDTVTLNLRPETKATRRADRAAGAQPAGAPAGALSAARRRQRLAEQAVGSVLYDLDVPDFAKAPLAMSGLVLTSAAPARSCRRCAPTRSSAGAAGAARCGSRDFPVRRRARAVRRDLRQRRRHRPTRSTSRRP